jgi:hypothetical protein
MLLLHIIIALASIVYTGYVFLSPSQAKLRNSYLLVAGTLASGTYLVVIKPSHLLPACLSGLAYLGVVSIGIVAARMKLAAETDES